MPLRSLLLTDVVDSTRLSEELGDVAMAELWARHDRVARDLLPLHHGREIDKTDGFLLLFDTVADAVAYASEYHRALAALGAELGVPLAARAGVHWGHVTLTENRAEDVARGAKPLEVDGIAKPTAARIMSAAPGGRTLGSAAARQQLDDRAIRAHSHGHWQLKGVSEPVELFELRDDAEPPEPPVDVAKVYRVVSIEGVWQPVRAIPNNLPFPRDSFIGRAADLLALEQRLDAEAAILTVVGPGGTGKTRLGVELARRTLGQWAGGAWLVELELVHDAGGLLHAIATALGVQLMGTDTAAWLAGLLRERGPTLLVLDNFEQLVHAGAVVERLSQLAPDTRWVVTSREPLKVRGERVVALEPLALPDEADPPTEVRANPAVRLFLDRAEAVAPSFVRSDADLGAVAALVRLLEGMPLALELAAARARVMSPEKMVERVSERFRLLSGGRRGATSRQATLRGAIDWSWDLLEPWERHALTQCAVFQGGFTLQAAEAVIDLSAWPDAPWAEDVVQTLLEKSLLRSWKPSVGGAERHELTEPLFGMYVSIHEYATEKLGDPGAIADVQPPVTGPDASRAVRLRHAAFFGDHEARIADAAADLRRLDLDRENLVAAFETATGEGQAQVAAGAYLQLGKLAVDLGPPSLVTDRWERLDTRALPDRLALACTRPTATALAVSAQLDRASEVHARAAEIAERLGEIDVMYQARGRAITAGRIVGIDLDALRALRDEAAARGATDALIQLDGSIALAQGGEEAAAFLEQVAREDNRYGWAARYNLGCALMGLGRAEEALALAREVLDIGLRMGIRTFEMFGHNNLGQAGAMLGLPGAREDLERALALARSLGQPRFVHGGPSTVLVILDLEEGRREAARARLAHILPMLRALGDPMELAWCLGAQAWLAHLDGRPDDAEATWREVDACMPEWATARRHDATWLRRMRAAIDGAERAD